MKHAPWRAVITQSLIDVWQNNVMEWAAALSLYAVLSVFPLLLAAVAMASVAVSPEVASQWLTALSELLLPAQLIDPDAIVATAFSRPGQITVIGVLLWIVGGRRIIGVLITALNHMSDVDQRHETVRRRLLVEVSLLMGIGVVVVGTIVLVPTMASWWPWSLQVIRVLAVLAVFITMYAVVPRGYRAWPAVITASVMATAMLLVVRVIFLRTADAIWSGYAIIYGPLALAALLLMWGWLIGGIVLIGGSLASHIKVMVVLGASRDEASRRHVPRIHPAD